MPRDLIENRIIRVFISSTFQDMQDERTELIRKTFPRLRDLAAQRDVTLTEVDLRWGITKEESESGKVMEICLREVENSIPFFIGIIGNRYGWIPGQEDISDIVKERFKEVPNYVERHLSATEIEMQFGVLDRKDVDMNAYFFIKEEETSDIDDPERLAALKKAVRENKKYPVSTYKDPEGLAEQVLAAFTKLLDDLFPVGELSALEKERLGQRAVLNNLSRVYIKTESNFAVIDKWMEGWEKHQLVITGASGLGKSALVANWIKEKLKLGEELPYRIIYHFVGYGGSVGSDWHVVKALCDEIRDRYGFEADVREPKTDEKALDDLFKRVAFEGDKPLLIVLDGINQIIDVNYAKRLNWLPIPPRKVKILFTTLEDDGTMEVFKDRKYPIFTLQPLTREERIEMVRRYLDKTYRKHLEDSQLERIVDDLQNENTLVLKTLLDEIANFGSFEQLDEKIEEYLKPDSISDFYQVVLQNYEADFGEELVRHFLSLIAVSRNGLSEDEILEITDTKDKPILWSQFFCSFRQHMVVKNGFVSFAHSYIREAVEERYVSCWDREDLVDWVWSCREEIVAVLESQKTHEGKKTDRSMDEVPYQLDHLGDLTRMHDYLMDIEVFSYLYNTEELSLSDYWHEFNSIGGYSLLEYIPQLEYYDNSKQVAYLFELGGFTLCTLVDYSLSIQFFERALSLATNEIVQAEALRFLGLVYGEAGNRKSIEYGLKALDIDERIYGTDHPDTASSYNNVGLAYGHQKDYQKELEYGLKALDIRERILGRNHPDTVTSYNNVGLAYGHQKDYQKELEYGLKALDIRERIYGKDHLDTATSYNNVGVANRDLGNYQKALDYGYAALEIQDRLYRKDHPDIAITYDNLGVTYGKLDDLHNELECELKALEILQNCYDEINVHIAIACNNIGLSYLDLGDYKKALEYELRALRIDRALFGELSFDVAQSYSNIGVIYDELGVYQKALDYAIKVLEISKSLCGEYHRLVAISYNNVGAVYTKLSLFDKAVECRVKALSIATVIKDDQLIAVLLNHLAQSYSANNELERASFYFHQAAEKYRELGDEEQAQANMIEISKNDIRFS